MPKNKAHIEDILTLGSNILGNLLEARHEVRAQAKQRATSLLRHLDLVRREEFDAAFAMLSKARLMQDDFQERLKKIEDHLKLSKTDSLSKAGLKAKKRRLLSVKKDKQRSKLR